MVVYAVKNFAYYGRSDDDFDCYFRIFSTEEQAMEYLTSIFNEFISNCDTEEEERIITEYWEKDYTVCDENGKPWAYMSDYVIDSNLSF
jgi:hypothetical protein